MDDNVLAAVKTLASLTEAQFYTTVLTALENFPEYVGRELELAIAKPLNLEDSNG